MIVVGGTYDELCFEPRWEEKFGSGLRACRAINSLNPDIEIEFYTFGDENCNLYLEQINTIFPKIRSTVTKIKKTVSFYYDHPLITPRIYPRLDTLERNDNNISVSGDDVLFFGLIEGSARVNAKRLVYDPQSPSNPIPFSKTGSTAEELVVVVNHGEASKMAKTSEIDQIKNYFFDEEKANILILKMGAKGAMIIEPNKENVVIPVFKTSSVWPIGSGDVFASVFSYYWFNGMNPENAAHKASLCTAIYSSTRKLDFENLDTDFEALTVEKYPKGKIYLAGPFFTYAERWLIDQIRRCLTDMGLKVFSPWHDIGHGMASDVVAKDLIGLEESKLVFAVIDGLDSGTLFEVGYAVSKKIPVLGYVENETEESVKMIEGTGCILEKDLTTAIYKSLWILSENE